MLEVEMFTMEKRENDSKTNQLSAVQKSRGSLKTDVQIVAKLDISQTLMCSVLQLVWDCWDIPNASKTLEIVVTKTPTPRVLPLEEYNSVQKLPIGEHEHSS